MESGENIVSCEIIPSIGKKYSLCAKTTRTCQIIKWTDVKHPKCEVVLCAADKSKNTLPHARLPPLSKNVKYANNSPGTKKI